MKAVDYKTKTEKELNTELTNLKKEAMNLRFQKVTGELKNLSRIRVVRRSIAMINTLINAKKRNSEK
jgi:large subunit ribosomal protein L29